MLRTGFYGEVLVDDFCFLPELLADFQQLVKLLLHQGDIFIQERGYMFLVAVERLHRRTDNADRGVHFLRDFLQCFVHMPQARLDRFILGRFFLHPRMLQQAEKCPAEHRRADLQDIQHIIHSRIFQPGGNNRLALPGQHDDMQVMVLPPEELRQAEDLRRGNFFSEENKFNALF